MDVDYLRTAEDTKTFFIHQKALDEIREMYLRVERIKQTFGATSDEYLKAADSLLSGMVHIFGLMGFSRQMHVTRDGDLSLYCNEDDKFVFGMIFHRDRKYDDPPRPDLPQPGEWSLHS